MERSERRRALLVSAVLVVAVAWPGVVGFFGHDSDGFPVSTYPMFSRDPGRVVEVPTVIAVEADGTTRRLSPQLIAGTDQVIQAVVTVRQAIDAGPAATATLCEDVAAELDDVGVTVAVVVERHDAHAWSAGRRRPLERRQLAECEAST